MWNLIHYVIKLSIDMNKKIYDQLVIFGMTELAERLLEAYQAYTVVSDWNHV